MLLASCSFEDPDPADAAVAVPRAAMAVTGCQQQADGNRGHDELLVPGETAAAAITHRPGGGGASRRPAGTRRR